MATAFNTQVGEGKYQLQFETDCKEHYLLMQKMARRCVDGRTMEWISVEERLPERGQDVLIYFETGDNMAVGFITDQDGSLSFWSAYTDDGWYTDCDSMPQFWMQLPEPPKEVE